MAMETKQNLDDSTISKLQKLIRYNIDSSKGFRECAEDVNDPALSQLFRDLAMEREQNSEVLQTYVEWNGEEAEDEGGIGAAVHRIWIGLRSRLRDDNSYGMLAEAERGEDYIKKAYEDVLQQDPGSAMSDLLHEQYRGVKAAHDRIRDLRDAAQDE